ncbi:MAG: FG-nucleoporin nsp1, partial [Vezdaea aestivalis]
MGDKPHFNFSSKLSSQPSAGPSLFGPTTSATGDNKSATTAISTSSVPSASSGSSAGIFGGIGKGPTLFGAPNPGTASGIGLFGASKSSSSLGSELFGGQQIKPTPFGAPTSAIAEKSTSTVGSASTVSSGSGSAPLLFGSSTTPAFQNPSLSTVAKTPEAPVVGLFGSIGKAPTSSFPAFAGQQKNSEPTATVFSAELPAASNKTQISSPPAISVGSKAPTTTSSSSQSAPALTTSSGSALGASTGIASQPLKDVGLQGRSLGTTSNLFGTALKGKEKETQSSVGLPTTSASTSFTPSAPKAAPLFGNFSTTPAGEPPQKAATEPGPIFGGAATLNSTTRASGTTSNPVAPSTTPAFPPSLFGSLGTKAPLETAKETPKLFSGLGKSSSSGLFGKPSGTQQESSTNSVGTTTPAQPASSLFSSKPTTQPTALSGAPSSAPKASESQPKRSFFGTIGSGTSSSSNLDSTSASSASVAPPPTIPGSLFGTSVAKSASITAPPISGSLFGSSAAKPAGSEPPISVPLFGGSSTKPAATQASTGSSFFGIAAPQSSSIFGKAPPAVSTGLTSSVPPTSASSTLPGSSTAQTSSTKPAAASPFGSIPTPNTSSAASTAGITISTATSSSLLSTSASTAASSTGAPTATVTAPATTPSLPRISQCSAAGPAPTPESRLNHKSMEEIVQDWSTELSKHQNAFKGQAEQVGEWDRLLIENQDKIGTLYTTTFQAERESTEIERQLTQVESQQTELLSWLEKYEHDVDEKIQHSIGGAESLQGPDQEREQTYLLAEKLSKRMDEMTKDLTGMIEEVNNASTALSKTSSPDDP